MYSNNIKQPGRLSKGPAYHNIHDPSNGQYQTHNNDVQVSKSPMPPRIAPQRPGSIARTQHQYHKSPILTRPSEMMPLQQANNSSLHHDVNRIARPGVPADGHYSSLQPALANSLHYQHPAPESLKNDLLSVHRRHSLQQEANPQHRRSSLQDTKSQYKYKRKSSLTKDLQDIHRRNSMHGDTNHRNERHSVYKQVDREGYHDTEPRKKRHSKKTSIHPLHKQDEQLYEKLPINTLASIADQKTGLDLGSYTKDYVRLSMEYKRMEKYRRGYKHVPAACIKCSRISRHIGKVFFPCEHICVCDSCLAKQLPKKCALCNQAIRIILDHTGKEQEQYWKWIEEVKPSISNAFLKSFFVQSKDAIRLAMADTNVDYASSIGSQGHRSYVSEERGFEEGEQQGLPPTIMTMIRMVCRKLFFFRRRTSRVRIQEWNTP